MRYFIPFVLLSLLFSCGPNLHEVGIPANATVFSKRELDLKKNRYYITVSFFTQPDAENPEPKKTTSDSPKTVDEIIEGLTIDVNFGDYTTAEIEVSSAEYDRYNEGDDVKIRYEKGNPPNAVIDNP